MSNQDAEQIGLLETVSLPEVGKLYRLKTGRLGPGAGSVAMMINVSYAVSSEPGKFIVRVKFLTTCLGEAKVYDIRFGWVWGENWRDYLELAEQWTTQT